MPPHQPYFTAAGRDSYEFIKYNYSRLRFMQTKRPFAKNEPDVYPIIKHLSTIVN